MISLSSRLLTLEGVSKRYHATQPEPLAVLEGVSLSLNEGDRYALTGPSGSGKSTLTHLIAGTEEASEGVIQWRGAPLPPVSSPERSAWRLRQLGLVFQDFRLFPHLSALENAALPLELLGRSAREAEERASALLKRVGLSERASHLPSQLSGGEQQRVAIARALAHEPALIIADEPTGNLDWRSAERVVELLFELSEERGVALLIVTHDLTLAGRADRHEQLLRGALSPFTAREGQ